MIQRALESRLRRLATLMPAITVTGPRQSGKTTLCRHVFRDREYRNLESPDLRRFAEADPRGFLATMPQGGVIDEAQRVPDLFSYLQVDIDAHRDQPGRWVLSGSQNFLLIENVTQSLAGRAAITHLLPLEWSEWRLSAWRCDNWYDHALRGGYPALADPALDPREWTSAYIETYLERDVRQLSQVGNLSTFRLFLELCAGRSGREWNTAALASDVGVSRATVERWLSILDASFLIHRVRPYHRNVRKRLVKRPRMHMLDSALQCHLLGIGDRDQLRRHPLRGAVFESWVVGEIHKARVHRGEVGPLFYYRDQHGIEVDVIVEKGRRAWLVEAKSAATYQPEMARNLMRVSTVLPADLEVSRIVIYGGMPTADRQEAAVFTWDEIDRMPWLGA